MDKSQFRMTGSVLESSSAGWVLAVILFQKSKLNIRFNFSFNLFFILISALMVVYILGEFYEQYFVTHL